MQGNNNQPTTYCHSCGRNILTSNFLLHEGRCQRLSQLRSSRVSSNEQKHQTPFHTKVPEQIHFEPIRQPYSFSKMNIKQDIRGMKKKPQKMQTQEKIPCPFCGYMQTLLELDTHPNKCEHREVACNFCAGKYPQSLMNDHAQICQKNPRNIQRNQRNMRTRMRRNHTQEYEELSQEEDGMPMIYNQRNRNMYQPSSLMDLFNNVMLTGGRGLSQEQFPRGQGYQVIQFTSNNNEQPRVIFRTNSTNPSTFIQLIEMMTRRANPNQNPGLSQEELANLPKVAYHKKNKDEEPDLCTICYCEFQQNQEVIKLSCKHLFHQECIFEWLKRVSTCPVCKKKLKQRRGQEEQGFEQYEEPVHNHHQHQHQHQQRQQQQQQGGFFNFFPF